PPRHALDRMRDRIVRALMRRAVRPQLRRLNELRASLDLPPLASHEDLFLRPPHLLYRTAPPFDYPRAAWPLTVHPIGPGLWAPESDAPAWLEALPRPRTLVGVSTELQQDGAIVETALRALADEPGSVVVTTAALDPDRFEAPNDRVRIERFVPHAAVVPEMDVVVTHGGMGTTQRALAAGVPVCVVPWGRDQAEVARRVQVSGAGTMLPRARLTPERLRAAVHEARTRAPAAKRIARAFRAAGGAERAVALIEGWLRTGPTEGRAPGDEDPAPVATRRSREVQALPTRTRQRSGPSSR
ncbi:MAG: nucleotide disphospho-sugar-binding domain-containing protein, partial [Trueperaceae bacterium]